MPWSAIVGVVSLMAGFVGGAVVNAFRFGSFKTMCEGEFKALNGSMILLNTTANEARTEIKKIVVHEIHIASLQAMIPKYDALERDVRMQGHDIRELRGMIHQLPDIRKFLAEDAKSLK